jgi:hypothetical protein
LAEQIAKVPKAGHLDAESITEVRTRIASHPSTRLLVREKVVKATPPALPLLSLTSSHCVKDLSPSPPPENIDEKVGQSLPPRRQRHDASKYSEEDRPEMEVRET